MAGETPLSLGGNMSLDTSYRQLLVKLAKFSLELARTSQEEAALDHVQDNKILNMIQDAIAETVLKACGGV